MRLKRIFTKKRVYILIFLWLGALVAFNIGPWSISALNEISGGIGIPDMMGSYDLDKLNQVFLVYGQEGMAIYAKIQLLDFIYPLIYGPLLLGLLSVLHIPKNFSVVYSIPFTVVFFDYSENILLWVLSHRFPNLTQADSHLVNLASICTNLKWSFLISALLVILGFWIWNVIMTKNNKNLTT